MMRERSSLETTLAQGATLDDIDTRRLEWFMARAKDHRGFSLSSTAGIGGVLDYLNLKERQHLTNAALLLFGCNPQHFTPSAVVKCSFYHGTEVSASVPSHQEFGGTLFQQIDDARDFVLARLTRAVGPRNRTPSVDVVFEVPPSAVLEIIVNAVAHRDYDAPGSIQITVYADRIEIMNPGRLPDGMKLADLEKPHTSQPTNPFLARPLFLAGYMEQLGVGIPRVIEACRSAGLPTPRFEQRSNQFLVTLWRDVFTPDRLEALGLNARQKKAVAWTKETGRIANSPYQDLTGVSRKTAARDLDDLVQKGVLMRIGERRGIYYVLTTRK
ncbi:hypothetical protein LR032_03420 [Candidatus Bipolaricaulota bacterium]|nr:hypothetical protein [Candidatus Bipolaricaulota bacterium]